MKIYITTNVLTQGIMTRDTKSRTLCSGGVLEIEECGIITRLHRDDWYYTLSAAIARAEELRDKKVKSLQKQATKLVSMTFTLS